MAPEQKNHRTSPVIIKVVGVGGGGNNAVDRMVSCNIKTAQFISVNTDIQALSFSTAQVRMQIGNKHTRGEGAGGDPSLGQKAAEENRLAIKDSLQDANLVFITAGMGGGTGTGAAPVIADIAKNELGKLTVAIVTKPFLFEGKQRMLYAETGLQNLKNNVDTLIVVPNQKLLEVAPNLPMLDCFRYADDILRQAVQGISDLIVTRSLINLDFADVKRALKDSGVAHLGIGKGTGEHRAIDAIKQAVSSPLLESSIEGAERVVLNIIGSKDLRMKEVEEIGKLVKDVISKDALLIFGADVRETLNDEIIVTVIAAGFRQRAALATPQPQAQLQRQLQPLNVFGTATGEQRFSQQPYAKQAAVKPPITNSNYPNTRIAPDLDNPDLPDFLRDLNRR